MTDEEYNILARERQKLVAENIKFCALIPQFKKGSIERRRYVELHMNNINRIKEINRNLKSVGKPIQRSRHTVSDHALVRWLEREHLLDMAKIKDKIIVDTGYIYNGSINRNGLEYIFVNGCLVTVIPMVVS